MSSEAEVKRVFSVLMLAYPNYRPDEQTMAATIKVYARLLADIPFDLLEAAALDAASRCKFMPTPAEIRESAMTIVTGGAQATTALEAWGHVKGLVEAYGRLGWERASAQMDDITRETIAALGWIDFCNSDLDDEQSWRARFVELYSQKQAREREAARQLPVVREMTARQLEARKSIRNLAQKLTAPTSKVGQR